MLNQHEAHTGPDSDLLSLESGAEGCYYVSPQGYVCKTDAAGRFRLDLVPVSSARIRLRESDYCLVPRGGRPFPTRPVSSRASWFLCPAEFFAIIDGAK
ncbi:MAG: hypothetical protein ABSF26_00165 [Thermoguttaceae bacterium]